MSEQWLQSEAIALCREVEEMCPEYGCHVALTGGLLYKDGPRKDCDLVFYRIRQVEEINWDYLEQGLSMIGFTDFKFYGFCVKAKYKGRPVDMLFPEVPKRYHGLDINTYPVKDRPNFEQELEKTSDDPLVASIIEVQRISE